MPLVIWYIIIYAILQIPLSGYGGLSRLVIDNLPLLANQNSIYCQELDAASFHEASTTVATISNVGCRAAYVQAVAFKGAILNTFFLVIIYFDKHSADHKMALRVRISHINPNYNRIILKIYLM